VSELLAGLAAVRRALARRRAALVLLGTAAALAAAWGTGAFLAWAGLFRVVRWAPAALWLAGVGALAVAMRAAWRAAALAQVASVRDAAALVEGELGLRRGSLVGLVDTRDGAPAGTSDALVAEHARLVAARLPEGALARWAPGAWRRGGLAMRRLGVALAAALVLATAGFLAAGDAALVLASPLRALRAGLGSAVEIAVSATRVRRGGGVLVTVRSPGAVRAALHLREPGEPWRPVALDADAEGRASYRLGGLTATVHLFATAGGAASDTLTVEVVQPAVLTGFGVTATYPAYLAREEETLPADAGPLVLPVGTVLALRGSASAPLARAALVAGSERVALRVRGTLVEGRLVVRGSAAWHLALEDAAGQAVPEPLPTLDLRAVPDSAPVVTVAVPGADTTAPLDLRQALVVDARDDHALGHVAVVSWRVSASGLRGEPVVDTLPGAAGFENVVLSTVLDLNARGLFPGDTLRYLVRAADRAPVPHVGTSREYALRLRSSAELRDAVRADADTLARAAGTLAGDQTALARRTEDLAAQRQRAAEGARPGATGDAAAPQPPGGGTGPLPFEQAQEAARIREEQARLLQRADSLRGELTRLARAAADAGLNDPAWQQQLKDLDDLLRQAITPEMAQSLEALRRALERLDPEAVRQALARLAASQRDLREQLERSRELFERAALEGSVQAAAANAEELQRNEERWARQAPARRDSGVAAQEQSGMRRDLDSLASELRDLARRLAARRDSASTALFGRQQERTQTAGGAMDAAQRQMQRGDRTAAAERGNQASETLRPMARELRDQQQRMAASWRAEVLRLLQDAVSETVTLAAEQQRLAREVREGSAGPAEARGREGALQQGVGQVVRRLSQAAGENALVSPRLGASLGRAQRQMEEARQSLEGQHPTPDAAAEQGDEAARSLSAAAMEMVRNSGAVAGSQSGSGLAEALRQMAGLAQQQGALTDQAGGFLPLLGAGGDAVLMQLRALAARQRAIADQLERLGGSGLPGHPERLAPEARDLADRLEQGRLDRATMERQQRLFHRMLDAGRTLRNDDDEQEPERRSRTAQEGPVSVPAGALPREGGLRYPLPAWDALRQLSPGERAMVLDYFRRLNAPAPR
jgi:hypothetical protein